MIESCAMSFELPPLVRSTAIFIVFFVFQNGWTTHSLLCLSPLFPGMEILDCPGSQFKYRCWDSAVPITAVGYLLSGWRPWRRVLGRPIWQWQFWGTLCGTGILSTTGNVVLCRPNATFHLQLRSYCHRSQLESYLWETHSKIRSQ